jgi:hypothetical protein
VTRDACSAIGIVVCVMQSGACILDVSPRVGTLPAFEKWPERKQQLSEREKENRWSPDRTPQCA